MEPGQVTVVIPTYNEADNIAPMTTALFDLQIPELQILVVDDASPDGTGEIADRLAAQYAGRFAVCHRTGPRGLGWAYVEGFRWALEQGATYIIQMDCDFYCTSSFGNTQAEWRVGCTPAGSGCKVQVGYPSGFSTLYLQIGSSNAWADSNFFVEQVPMTRALQIFAICTVNCPAPPAAA